MQIKPLKNCLFVEIDKENNEEVTTKDGIIIPKAEQEYIVKVSEAGENDQGIKQGDTILLNTSPKFLEYRIGTKYYRMIPVSYVVAILKD